MKNWKTYGLLTALLALMLTAAPARAQVHFETVSTDSVRALARAQQKLVFIDLYATWCPPCRAMERQVFSQPEVGDFMAQHFVAAKYDVDKRTGRQLLDRYGHGAVPLYLVFDTTGTLWGTIQGAAPIETFIANLERIIARYREAQP